MPITIQFDKVGGGTKQISLTQALQNAANGKIKTEPGKTYLQDGNDLLLVNSATIPVVIP